MIKTVKEKRPDYILMPGDIFERLDGSEPELKVAGFELIGTYDDVEDYFVARIKRKKWKDIQLKFHSKTRFSLEEVTLECFVGGYVKR